MKKLVKEQLNEKFEKQSDPIHDMGIGVCYKKVNDLREKLADMWDENYEKMLADEDRSQALDTIEQIRDFIDEIFDE